MKMKNVGKLSLAVAIALTICLVFAAAYKAQAADSIISAKIESVSQGTTKSGDQYTRVIVQETRSLKGIEYEAGVPVMFFGTMAADGARLQPGQTLKAVAQQRNFNGSVSYTALKLIE